MSCADLIKKAIDNGELPPMSKEAADDLLGEVERIRQFVGEREGVLGENFRKAIIQYLDNRRFERIAEAKEAKENLVKLQTNFAYVKQDAFKGQPSKAILGKLLGGEGRYSTAGSRGAAVVAEGLHAARTSGMYSKLKEAGYLEVAEKGLIDRDVAQEIYNIDYGTKGSTGNPHAVEIAKIMRAATDSMLADKQAAGSSVRRAKGYVAKTTHDREKVLAVGEEEWKATILQMIDREKTFGAYSNERVDYELSRIYGEIVSGDSPLGVVEARGRNVGREQALARTFIFKDGYSWFDYNNQFGRGNLLETVLSESRKSASQTALMEQFGTNPELGFQRLLKQTENFYREDPETMKRFREDRKNLEAAFARAQGYADTPGTSLFSRVSRDIRLWQSIAKTGGASLSTMSDLAFSVARIRSQTGNSLLGEVGSQISTFFGGLSSETERLAVARKLGIMLDNFQGELLDKFGAETAAPGGMAKAAQVFQRLNLMKYIDQSAAYTGALRHAETLAGHAGTAWSGLDDRVRLSLRKYGFDERSWNLARQATEEVAGRTLMTPEAVRALPDDVVEAIYPEGSPEKARFTVAANLLSLYGETASASASRASPRVQHVLLGSSVDDGAWGTFQRLLVQFKQPIVQNMRTAAETLMANPASQPRTAFSGKSDFYGFSGLLVLSTMLGYAKIVAKEAAMGRTPPSPEDPEVALQAFLNGGATGLYGDFLFKELHRNYGQTGFDLAVGPVIGESVEILDMGRRALRGEATWDEVWRKTWDNVPGHNLFYAKAALDYLIANQINETLNPGYQRRLERRAATTPGLFEEKQSYFMLQPTRR